MTEPARDPLIGPAAAPDLHVMTYNIRRRIDLLAWLPNERWSRRRRALREMLAAERPTVIGVQEAFADQARDVREALGPGYRRVGHGRDRDGGGEGAPVFFDAERLALVDFTQAALSDTPDVAGSRSWGNLVPRVLVTALLRDRATDRSFAVLNTHLDALSKTSRMRSAAMIRHHVQDLGSRDRIPAIVLGDLNARPHSDEVRELLADDLEDAWSAADVRITPEWSTYTRYRGPRRIGGRLDAIAVTRDIRVGRIAVHAQPVRGRWPSDHLPVQALVRIEPEHDRGDAA